jgi:hypothetical protein
VIRATVITPDAAPAGAISVELLQLYKAAAACTTPKASTQRLSERAVLALYLAVTSGSSAPPHHLFREGRDQETPLQFSGSGPHAMMPAFDGHAPKFSAAF